MFPSRAVAIILSALLGNRQFRLLFKKLSHFRSSIGSELRQAAFFKSVNSTSLRPLCGSFGLDDSQRNLLQHLLGEDRNHFAKVFEAVNFRNQTRNTDRLGLSAGIAEIAVSRISAIKFSFAYALDFPRLGSLSDFSILAPIAITIISSKITIRA